MKVDIYNTDKKYNASYPEEKEWVAIYPNQIKAIENILARIF